VDYGFIEDGKHRKNLAIAAFCNGCIDCANETKHTYCLGFLAPCGNPLQHIIMGMVFVPLYVIGDCFRVDHTPPRRRKELEDAIHCRHQETTVFGAVGPECLWLRENCCNCCVKAENKPALTAHYQNMKATDAYELKLHQEQKRARQQQMK
jgi:hypothetical protein